MNFGVKNHENKARAQITIPKKLRGRCGITAEIELEFIPRRSRKELDLALSRMGIAVEPLDQESAFPAGKQ